MEPEQIDLSGLVPEPKSIVEGDREFNPQDLRGLISYLKEIRDKSLDFVVPGSQIELVPGIDNEFDIKFNHDGTELSFTPTSFAKGQTIGGSSIAFISLYCRDTL